MQKFLGLICKGIRDDYVLYGSMPPGIDSVRWHMSNIKSGMYYKIIYENSIIGGIKLFEFVNGHFRIGTIYIDPAYQNKNIGILAIRMIEKQSSYQKVVIRYTIQEL